MKIWLICLLIEVCIIPVGLLLRYMAGQLVYGLLPWGRNGKHNMNLIWSNNGFFGLLLAISGTIENLALLGFIIGIPLYFIFGI